MEVSLVFVIRLLLACLLGFFWACDLSVTVTWGTAVTQTSYCATLLPLTGPEVLPNWTTSITGLAPWKLFTLLFDHQKLPLLDTFLSNRLVKRKKVCISDWISFATSCVTVICQSAHVKERKKQIERCLSMHVVIWQTVVISFFAVKVFVTSISAGCEEHLDFNGVPLPIISL